MALDKRLQNPKRSAQDPTELEARLTALEERIKKLEDKELLQKNLEKHLCE